MIIYHPGKHWKKQVKAIEEEGEKQKEPIYKQWEKQLGAPSQNINDDGFSPSDRNEGRDNKRL